MDNRDLPFCSVVVCTRNRASILAECLDRLVAQRYPAEQFEILVVDDGSTDATAEVVALHARARPGLAVHYHHQPHGGVNRARNAGIRAARGEVVLFVDDDELAREEQLALYADTWNRHPGIDAAGGPVRDYGGDTPRLCSLCSWESEVRVDSETRRPDRLLGGNMAIRRAAFERLGNFDETLSGAGDEVEWFYRSADKIRLAYDPNLWLWHRRDSFGVGSLILRAYRQGKILPRFQQRVGGRYRPRPVRVLRGLWHALRRRCSRGLLVAARECGAIAGWLRAGRRDPGEE